MSESNKKVLNFTLVDDNFALVMRPNIEKGDEPYYEYKYVLNYQPLWVESGDFSLVFSVLGKILEKESNGLIFDFHEAKEDDDYYKVGCWYGFVDYERYDDISEKIRPQIVKALTKTFVFINNHLF